jgi:hypothetical protein
MELLDHPNGNYRFLTGNAPYSSGVVARPGHEIVRVTLQRLLPYPEGFALIDSYLREQGQPRHALCAIELRLPRPLSFAGFAEFNRGYQELLADWDLFVDGHNPVARTNVAPEVRPPDEPSLFAFSHTLPRAEAGTPPTFVVAGAGELIERRLAPEAVLRAGETSMGALREKAAHVMHTMQARLDGLGVGWSEVTAVDIYAVHPLRPLLAAEVLARLARPPLTASTGTTADRRSPISSSRWTCVAFSARFGCTDFSKTELPLSPLPTSKARLGRAPPQTSPKRPI